MEYVQRELPYVRSFVLRSVYGVLRQEGITFGEEEPGRVIAEWREDGTDVSLSITAEEKAFGTELTVSLRRPCDGIPEQRAYRLLQEMLDQIVRHLENTLMTKGEEKTTNADGTPAAYLPKFGGGNRYRLVKLELLSRYYSDVLTIAHDYIITADYKLLPATEAIGEDYESGYIAYPPDVMEKLLALDGY